MKQTVLLWAMSLFGIHAFSGEILIESGTDKDDNFNGWYVTPFALFSNMEFHDDYVEFFSENGGEISIELMRKIPAMSDFAELIVEFRFDELINSRLNTISIYASRDGLHWEAIPEDATYKAVQFANPDYAFTYLKAVANVTFFSNGKMRWNYTRVEGKEDAPETAAVTSLAKEEELFTVFTFDKAITIRTAEEKPYTIMVTNMSGQIVHYEKVNGPRKIDTNFKDGVYIIHILQDDQMVKTQKVVL